ncbi:hypothetical protein CH341_31825, partial [Rhodoplanes roseus]
DEHFARLIRQGGKPVVLVANKAEGRAAESGLLEAYSLGFGEAVAVSAEHGVGLPDLYEAVVATLGEKAALYLPKEETDEDDEDEAAEGTGEETRTLKPIRVAIVGQ